MMPPNRRVTLEICVDSADAITACVGLADRIELCSGLDVGGLTPDPGLIAFAAGAGIETHVLIRPGSGDFTLSAADLTVAVRSIRAVRDTGLRGVVIGAEKAGRLDIDALRTMIAAAEGLDVTLHRVIDVLADPVSAIEDAVALGIRRVLTSGAAARAVDGTATLNAMHAAADGRIEIMAGAGITAATLPKLLAATPLAAFHASCSTRVPLTPQYPAFGFGEMTRTLDPAELRRLAALCGIGV